MRVPLLDLAAQYEPLREAHAQAMAAVVDSTRFILGPDVAALEAEVAAYLGTRHAVGVGSGTDALVLSLRALGIGPGDEVIVPAYTFFATAEAVLLVGATPVFVDIDPVTYTLRVDRLADAIGPRTRAVIPVHLFGQAADITGIRSVIGGAEVFIIEDNAQAFGATHAGKPTGGLGDAGCLSFFPSKNFACFGDGGMVVTNDPDVADRVRMLRTHGWRRKYQPLSVGYNSRLDTLQAAVLRVNLPHVDGWNRDRRAVAKSYFELLQHSPFSLPIERAGDYHVYHLFVIRTPRRDELAEQLHHAGVATGVYYPTALHQLAPCAAFAPKNGLEESERAASETLAIPLFPTMTSAQVETVAAALHAAVEQTPVTA
jgi:dTDP-4-amino-4,6-dideoxygalactose transaminase